MCALVEYKASQYCSALWEEAKKELVDLLCKTFKENILKVKKQ